MKVKPFKIAKPVQNNLIVQIDKANVFYDRLHQHDEIQISYIVEGQGKLFIANTIHAYGNDDAFVIAGNTPHLFQSIPGTLDSHMLTLFFTKESFGDTFFEIPELKDVNTFFDTSARGFRMLSGKKRFKRIMTQLTKADMLDKFLLFLKLIKHINAAEKTELTSFVQTKKITNNEGRRLQLVFDYMMNNFDKDIALNHVSDMVHMTPPAFCRFFKQRTNKTFFQFLIALRIEHACQMLLDPGNVPIAEISEKSGFCSISNFNRTFKKLKKATPSRYRKENRFEPGY